MADSPRVVAVCGSRREGSYTRTALQYALVGAADAGAETELLDLGDPGLDLPLYHPDHDPEETGDVAAALERVRTADGVVVGSPVYHGSYSSTFRSFHDWCSFDEYEDTAVGLLATAGGGTFSSTLDHMRVTVRGVHGWVIPHQVGVRNASSRFVDRTETTDGDDVDAAYVFDDDSLRDRTERLGREVTTAATRLFGEE